MKAFSLSNLRFRSISHYITGKYSDREEEMSFSIFNYLAKHIINKSIRARVLIEGRILSKTERGSWVVVIKCWPLSQVSCVWQDAYL